MSTLDEHVLLVRRWGKLSPWVITCTSLAKATHELDPEGQLPTEERCQIGWAWRILPVHHDLSTLRDDRTGTTWIRPRGFPVACLAVRLCPDCVIRLLSNRKH